MTDAERRLAQWVRQGAGRAFEAVPAATVVLLRDARPGLEVLLLRRNADLAFAGGMWVFPGGRVDPADLAAGTPGDELAAARRAAVREAVEEAGVTVASSTLVPFSHWTPPASSPTRFSTWFFVAAVPATDEVTVDGSEIDDHCWIAPADALARRDMGHLDLAPPTWITLWQLVEFGSVANALAAARDREPEAFETHLGTTDEGIVALYHGDAGYDDADASRPGARHRLWMLPGGWRYERD